MMGTMGSSWASCLGSAGFFDVSRRRKKKRKRKRISGNIVNMTFGLAMAFANTSLLLSYHIQSELRVKRFLEAFDSFHALISSAQNP